MKKIEKIVLIGVFLLIWFVLAAYAGGPIFSDEFMYIDAGLRNFAEPSYANRYFHVYLQKLFMELAPTPLQGIQIFWGFLIALTATLIYIAARTLREGSSIMHGLIAVAFFFSFPLIKEYSGEPAVDITAMMMCTVYLSLYLFSLQMPEKRKFFLIAIGVMAFLAFKTKETTIFINLLLAGYFFDESGEWRWDSIKKMVKPLLIGLAIGIGIMVVLDGLILGKPFFAIDPATFRAVLSHYDFESGFYFGPTNWFKVYFLDDIMVPFLLALLSGVRLQAALKPQTRLVWIYPLVMAAFVSWNMLKIPWGFIERFYFPALPAVAIFAPQFLSIKAPEQRKERIGFGLLLAASAGLILLLRSLMMGYSASLNFEYDRFLDSIYYPIILSLLLAAVLITQRFNWISAALPLFCLGALMLSPLMYSYKYFYRFPKVRERFDERFYPFETFKGELLVDEGDCLYISSDIATSLKMLSDDPNDITGMYNFFFDARISEANVYMGYARKTIPADLTERGFDFALLTKKDWEYLSDRPEVLAEVESLYWVAPDPSNRIRLLIRE